MKGIFICQKFLAHECFLCVSAIRGTSKGSDTKHLPILPNTPISLVGSIVKLAFQSAKCSGVKSSTQGSGCLAICLTQAAVSRARDCFTRLKATHESPAFSKRLETLLAKADPQFLLRFAMCPESKSVGCRFATPRSGPSPAKLT